MRRALVCLVIAAAAAVTTPGHAATIVGGDADELLAGTPGADTLQGLGGNDRLRGEAGDDVLDGGAGSDDIAGGAGRDAAVYSGPAGVVVTLDDLANDGAAGELDNVQTDVEEVFGTSGDDVLTGSAGAESLDGADGADRLDGGGGRDTLFGGGGDDRLSSRDGQRDVVSCGPGSDVAIVDEFDRAAGCEVVDRREAVPSVHASLTYEWDEAGPRTAYPLLEVSDVFPARATIELRCAGAGCTFTKRTNAHRRLTRTVRGLLAAPGTRLEIRLTAPGHVGKLFRLEARRGASPIRRELCLRGRRQRASVRCS